MRMDVIDIDCNNNMRERNSGLKGNKRFIYKLKNNIQEVNHIKIHIWLYNFGIGTSNASDNKFQSNHNEP